MFSVYRISLKTLSGGSCFVNGLKLKAMPWYHGDYPPSYKNLPQRIREKAVEIANAILEKSGDEGLAIATGVKRAKEWAEKQDQENENSTKY